MNIETELFLDVEIEILATDAPEPESFHSEKQELWCEYNLYFNIDGNKVKVPNEMAEVLHNRVMEVIKEEAVCR
jgi:hypothetical protein